MTAIRGQNLVIFEGDQKYYVETSLMTSTGLQLDPHKYKWDDNELKTGVMKLISEKQLKPEEVNTVYMIYFENARVPLPNFEGRPFLSKVKLRIDHTKFAALLFTEKTVYTMDIAEESKPILYREYHNKFTEFAIIHDQKQTKQTGYVINKGKTFQKDCKHIDDNNFGYPRHLRRYERLGHLRYDQLRWLGDGHSTYC